jgi:ribosomal protein S18 acetylase RimI-like enzyme
VGRLPPLLPVVNLLPWLPDRPERTATVHELTQRAFAPYAALARPSGALAETVDDVAADLAAGGGLIAYDDRWDRALGALRWRVEDDHLWVKRVAVDPSCQRQGVGDLLMDACQGICHATRRTRIRLGVRHALEDNRAWYERRGYRRVVDHDDWSEYEAEVAPIAFGERATLWKYEHPDHLQATFEVDVLEVTPDGTWVRIPRFTPHIDGRSGRIASVTPEPVVGWLPVDEWWTAWFSNIRRRLKVDICTPAVRRPDGDFEFHDLCLDVVVRAGEPPQVVDEDEFEAAGYDADVCARARRAADDVLRRICAREEPFATEAFRRL